MAEHGHVTVEPRDDVVAGSRVTLRFTYTVGESGMKAGGSLRIALPNNAWSKPLAPMHRYFQRELQHSGQDGGYCSFARRDLSGSVETGSGAWIDLFSETCHAGAGLFGRWSHHMVAVVCDGDLVEGDTIALVYGDTTWGEDGAEAPRVVTSDADVFRAYVDVTGEGEFSLLSEDGLLIRVLPGPPSRFNVVVPAVVRPGAHFSIKLAATDAFKNRCAEPFDGEVRLSPTVPGMAVSGSVSMASSDGGVRVVDEACAPKEGVYRVHAESAAGGTRTVSNPVWCANRELGIYFGDLHCQSVYHANGISVGTPDEGYAYARDVAGLDFAAMTDTGSWMKDCWVEIQESTNRNYEPGRFVTFKGFEFGSDLGHRNVIYRDCQVEPPLKALPSADLRTLFEYYRGRNDVLAIPHHPKVWTDWDYHDPELEPIVEAYSCWGSSVEHADPLWHKSEKPGAGVYSALARGYRLGFIGSGDSHAGTPGRSYPQDRYWCVDQRSGFACVYAPELTREAIFDALRNRRCYATTGVRLILEFSVDDCPMGGELDVSDPAQPRMIRVHAIGEVPLKHLRIVKNNVELLRRELDRDEEYFEYADTTPACNGDFYFVHVAQSDENAAWSSPVWVMCEG